MQQLVWLRDCEYLAQPFPELCSLLRINCLLLGNLRMASVSLLCVDSGVFCHHLQNIGLISGSKWIPRECVQLPRCCKPALPGARDWVLDSTARTSVPRQHWMSCSLAVPRSSIESSLLDLLCAALFCMWEVRSGSSPNVPSSLTGSSRGSSPCCDGAAVESWVVAAVGCVSGCVPPSRCGVGCRTAPDTCCSCTPLPLS